MSAQINLYHPRFQKRSDPLTLGNVALAAAALYLLLALAGVWAWQNATTRRDAALAAEAQLKAVNEQVEAATKAAANRKPSSQLAADVASAETLLRRRAEIARLLEGGTIGGTGGFSDYLRGFARQAPEGLWLTGFTIGPGGADMEIRGSVMDPAGLPEYIRRLGAEKTLQGRSFAALTMNRAEPPSAVRPVAQVAAVAPAPSSSPRPVDFVLMPKRVETKEVKQ